jgi:uncharacterized membrane protein YhaH (DUF805 family)
MGDRTNRRQFGLELLLGVAVIFVLSLVVSGSLRSGGIVGGLGSVLLLSSWRRLHDLGHSEWWALLPSLALAISTGMLLDGNPPLAFVVISGLIGLPMVGALLILPGQPGGNRYGSPPRKGLRRSA